jgi:predicted LPLAT superfamily acyltransferase
MNSIRPSDKIDHWAQLEERGVYVGLRVMLWAFKVFGRAGFSLLLYPVIGYFFLISSSGRKASRKFLSLVHADPRGRNTLIRPPGWLHSFKHFFGFGIAILDKLSAWTGGIRQADLIYENRAVFEGLQSSGRGGLLIASHLGNMEVCRALGQVSRGLKLNVLVHTKHARNFNRLLHQMSPDASVSLIQTTEVNPATAMMLHQRISQGEFVIIVGDRTPVNQSSRISWVSFLGRQAPFPQGPYILAALLECPVLVIFCLKRSGYYHVIFEHFAEKIDMPRRKRAEVLDRWTSQYVARLEHYCLTDPYQWFNYFDFWSPGSTIPPGHHQKSSSKSQIS